MSGHLDIGSIMSTLDQTGAVERYHLFDTAIGPCGIAWSGDGVTRLQLPERDAGAVEARLESRGARATAGPIPGFAVRAIVALQRYFAGRKVEFGDVDLDLDGVGSFHRCAYEAARAVGWGETVSYGALAQQLGSPHAARAVGQAMARNPVPIIVPCHRVLAGGGRIGGFSAFGGTLTKQRLLALEGVRLGSGARLRRDRPPIGGLLRLMAPHAGDIAEREH